MRVGKILGEGGESQKKGPLEKQKKGRARQIDLPKSSDLPPFGGTKTDLRKVEENAKKLGNLKLPSVLLSCCKTAIEKKGLYFRAEKGEKEGDLIGNLFKRLSGR